MYRKEPGWLTWAEKKFSFIALPNLALYLIVLQIFGILVVNFVSDGMMRLVLDPRMVLHEGEYWRLFTFMAVPLTNNIFLIFALWFLYFVVNALEQEWGEFRTTLYLLIAILATIAHSLVFGQIHASFWEVELTLFLAAATLFPEFEILLFLILPVKLKWLGIFSAVMLFIQFIFSGWQERIYLLLVFSNYFLFFGPAAFGEMKSWLRRRNFHDRWKK